MDQSQRSQLLTVPNLLLLSIAMRVFADTANQLFNPYLSHFATGLGASVAVVGALVTLRSLAGLAGPFLASRGDRVGYLHAMRVSLLLIAAGLFGFGLSNGVWPAALAMIPMGVGIAAFTPLLQAFLSTRLSYGSRGRGLGVVEYSWALAGIVGLSLAGQLIDFVGWRAPFLVLGTLMLVATLFLSRLNIPTVTPKAAVVPTGGALSFFRLGKAARSAWGSVIIVGLAFFGVMNVMLIHSEWLTREFGLGAGQLGMAALLFGLCDLGGSLFVSLRADAFGKRRLLIVGAALSLGSYLLLPFLQSSLISVLVGLGLVRLLMQVTYVSNIPVLSEQVPGQRGKVMALGLASGQLGMALAGLTGPFAYLQFGPFGLALLSALAMLAVLLIALFVVREAPLSTPLPNVP